MADLGAIEEDVPFDEGTANTLITACRAAATTIDGQAGPRSSWVTTAMTDFKGHFSELFKANGSTAAGDATELANRLREVATGAERLKEEAAKEQQRREKARAWQKEHDDRNGLEKFGDWLGGGDDPPVGPPADPVAVTVSPAVNGSREAPAPGGGSGGGGGGTSSARPSELRTFATGSKGANDLLRPKPGILRTDYADFQARCRWGTLEASGVFSGFDAWLAANDNDVHWATTLANAFKAAGGEGDVSSLSNSAVQAALQAANVTVTRQDLVIEPVQAQGHPPTSGYANDPVNTATGNFVETETDLAFPGAAAALQLSRTYNSFRTESSPTGAQPGAYGPGWSSVCEAGLVLEPDRARLVLPDGRQIFFPRLGDGWDRAVGESLWLTSDPGSTDLLVTGNEGSWWRLDDAGALLAFGHGPVGARAFVEVARDAAGRVVRLTHARGPWIELDRAPDAPHGPVVAARSADGRTVSYAYDDGRLESATGPNGTRTYRWGADGLLAAVVDADGVVEAENVYDASGRVTRQRSPFGRTTRFVYLPGRVTVVSDEDGTRSNTWIHDERGRLVGVVDADEHRQSTSYDPWGNPVLLTERDGATTVHEYDARGRRIRTVTPSGADLTYGYDALDRVTTVVTEQGAITEYTYDGELRNPSTVLDPEGGESRLLWADGLLTEIVDPTGVTLRLAYDERGDLAAVTNADGATARLRRDDLGRVVAATTPSGHTTTFVHDPRSGALTERHDPDGAVWRYEHSPAGRLTATVDPMGARVSIELGRHGEETMTIDPLGRAISRRFDDLGNLAAVTLPDGSGWRFTHDALSRLSATVDPTGATWTREHDAAGRLVAAVDPTGVRIGVEEDRPENRVEVGDGDGSSVTAFDALGRLTSLGLPDGSTAVWTYDRCGRPVEALDAEGALTLIRRDAAGRPVEVTGPTGTVTRYGYDRCGRLTAVTDPLGAVTSIGYDVDSLPITQVLANGEVARSRYDVCGQVVEHARPGAGTSRWTYDLAGRVVESRDPWWGRRRFRYDAAGQLVAVIDGNGGVTTYDYDANGRATAITNPLGGVTRREFDAANRCTAETDPLGRTTRAGYDAAGRLSWQESADGRRSTWTYDAAGRPASMAVDGRIVTALTRDLRRRTVRVTDRTDDAGAAEPVEHELEWNRRGQLVRRGRAGRSVRWAYDAEGRRTSMTTPDGNVTAYGWDAAGRLAWVDHTVLGRAAFDRDVAGRLVSSVSGGLLQTWEHRDGFVVSHTMTDEDGATRSDVGRDDDGRIVRVTRADEAGTATTDYAYDGACQLVEARTRDGSGTATRHWAYDAAGRLVAGSTSTGAGAETVEHLYDVAGQLLSTLGSDGRRTDYAYDGAGRRTHARSADAEREFLWNPSGYLAGVVERRPDGVRRTTTHADALGELAAVDGTELFWDTAAFAGAPVQVGDTPVLAAGPVTGIGSGWTAPGWRTGRRSGADPWTTSPGVAAGSGGATVGASGELSVAGLEWMGARAYDPAARGFLSVDPLDPVTGAGWAGNPYAFAGNDPLHALDPTGLHPMTDAELAAYSDGNGIGGSIKSVASSVGNWVSNNWEYVVGGLAVVGGVALMATGVGGPLGAMLVSAGADTIIQKATTGEVNWGEVGVSFVAGAVGGGYAAAKLGATGLRAAVVSGAVSGGVGGAATGGYQYATGPGPHSVTGFMSATAEGGARGAVFGGVGGAAGHGIVSGAGRLLDDVHPAPATPTPLNGAATVAKGERGVQASIAAAEGRGETVLGREVTVDTAQGRVRPDLLVRDANGDLKFIDSKNGPSAGLTPNQKVGYPELRANGGVPAGENARAAGLTPGVPIGPTPVQIDHWPSV